MRAGVPSWRRCRFSTPTTASGNESGWKRAEYSARQLAYWQEKLAGVPESLDLATDYRRPSVQSFAGATRAFTLDERLTARLKRLAEQQGGTLYMVLLAAFKALLNRYTGQERSLRGHSDRQPPVRGNGRPDRNVRQHPCVANPGRWGTIHLLRYWLR